MFDDAPATATAPTVPGVIAAGKPFHGARCLNDNLSIRNYYGTISCGDLRLGIGRSIEVDGFNAALPARPKHPVTALVIVCVSRATARDPYVTVVQADRAGPSGEARDQHQVRTVHSGLPDHYYPSPGGAAMR